MHSHPIFKAAAVIWILLGAISTILPFFPQPWADEFYGRSYIPKWPWYVWVIGLLIVALIAIFEGGHRQFLLLRGSEIGADDPILHFSLVDKRKQMARCTPFFVCNDGRNVARKIQIQPICLKKGTAQFRTIDHLVGAGDTAEAVPEISNCSPLFKYDFLNLLQHEANESASIDGNIVIAAVATYKDHAEKRCFTAPFEIVFNTLRFMLDKDESLTNTVRPVLEIKHGKVSVAPG
jgi:hypothetical protein